MKVSDLKPNEKNPRTISDKKLEMLKKAVREFGDLSGIVFNRKTKRLVGGHQRSKILDTASDIKILRKYPKPTKTGTIAEGFVLAYGEHFSYREVNWDETREKAANIAANKGAGEWDLPQLSEWMKELGSFDLDFDLDLTMFDEKERDKFVIDFSPGEEDDQGKLDQKKFVFIKCPHCNKVFEEGRNRVIED